MTNAERERELGLRPLRDVLTKAGISEELPISRAVALLVAERDALRKDKERLVKTLEAIVAKKPIKAVGSGEGKCNCLICLLCELSDAALAASRPGGS